MNALNRLLSSPDEALTFVDILRRRANNQPNAIAYLFLPDGETEEIRLTYHELDIRARSIAAQLQRQGARGERALLLYPSGWEFICAFFGCLYAGVVAVPAYPPRRNQHRKRLQAIVADAQAAFALTTTSVLTQMGSRLTEAPELTAMHWLTTDRIARDLAEDWYIPTINQDTLAFLQYTSGSTGTPKGVMVSHGNLLHNEQMIQQAFGHSSQTVFVGWLPLFHDMGLIGNVLQPLYLGIQSILMPPEAFLLKPYCWLQAISRYQATTSGGPNFAYDLCVQTIKPEQRASLDLSRWNVAFNGAEPVRWSTLEQFARTFADCGFSPRAFYPCYGMAETTLFVSGGLNTQLPVVCSVKEAELAKNQVMEAPSEEPGTRKIVGCGQAWLDETLAIVDPDSLTQCPEKQVGEIWVSGSSIAGGYWQRPEQTQETFQGYIADTGAGPFLRTGDLGFLREGELFITGRLKDLIIIRGRNHYPQDIELTVETCHSALRPHCGAAFSVPVNGQEKLVIAQEVKRSSRRTLNADEVIGAIRQAVAQEHDIDVYGIILLRTASIPKTSSGKVQRGACRDGFLADTLNGVTSWCATSQPSTRLQSGDAEVKTPPQPLPTAFNPKSPDRQEEIQRWLIARVSQSLQVLPEAIDIQHPLAEYGLSSMVAIRLAGEAQEWLGSKVSPTLLYDYPTIERLAQQLTQETATLAPTPYTPIVQRDAIAIIGLGCRFPGANDPDAFWTLLKNGVDAITEIPNSRWSINTLYDQQPATPGKMNTRWGGFLEQVDGFDADFFGISPREAERIDPQQRLLLEVAWETLEYAGLTSSQLAGSQTGVFIGISSQDYSRFQCENYADIDGYTGTGNALSIAANRLSYVFNWRGPSLAVDTACSSSLVSVHLACQSLQNGECQQALAGGVNLILSPELTITFSQAQMMAADGRCKTFDAEADGYVRAEGCGLVLLKRLRDAQRDGDNILAIIKGSAMNQDGRSNGLTAPNGLAQQAVIRQALANAGVKASQISYVETHGTGTALGDPIEVESLKAVRLSEQSEPSPCILGSVKANMGHLEAAAGIAGLIKVVLCLQQEEIPRQLHLNQLNPHISWDERLVVIPQAPQPWLRGGKARVAGVSSFGFGGTNAHVVLAEAPQLETHPETPVQEPERERSLHLLTLSAKTENALGELVKRYGAFLATHPTASLADICFSANTGRSHFNHRLAVVAESTASLREQLAAGLTGKETLGRVTGQVTNRQRPKLAFLFTGQGSQYLNMGQELYQTQPTFGQTLDRCDEILRPYLETSLLSVLYPEPGMSSPLHETAYTQPALFAIEYALVQLWQSWGVHPDAMMGHSVGEYVAACVAGVFSLEDGLKLIASRSRLMQHLDGGGEMVAVLADEASIRDVIDLDAQNVGIAAYNSPQNTVISGASQPVRDICAALEARGIKTKPLQVSHAFHSPLMEPMLAEFHQVAATITYQTPQIDLISNVTGERLTGAEITPDYWCRHVRQGVRLADSIKTLHACDSQIFVEIGPKPTVLGMARQSLPQDVGVWLPSLRLGCSDWQQLLQSLAELYVQGVPVDWSGFDRDYPRHRVILPTYPWQRSRYWIKTTGIERQTGLMESPEPNQPDGMAAQPQPERQKHPLLGNRLNHLAPPNLYIWETKIDSLYLSYLKDHRVWDSIVMPHSAYIEIALAATEEAFKSKPKQLTDLKLHTPLFLSEQDAQKIQVVLTSESDASLSFYLYSYQLNQPAFPQEWRLYATAQITL
jgi:acyl transferase domain-containing protein/acyl-CoA synthetase (AMP-forming)/AMP-acid ligase II/acyl carrier protein